MLNNITFFNSVEFPTTAPSPTIAFPLIKAQCLISASFPIIAGPFIYAVGAIVAVLAIHISSPLFSYSSLLNVFPNSLINSSIFGNTSQGYVAPSNIFYAIVSSKLYKFFILHSFIFFSLFFH